MSKRPFQWSFLRRLSTWGKASAFLTTMSLSALLASDIAVNTVNDSGNGSLRNGLAGASTGDDLVFNNSLNNKTLSEGAALTVADAVTFRTDAATNLTDGHAYLLAAPLTINWFAGGTLTLNGTLTNGSSNGSLINSGPGTLILNNSNSFSGGTTLSGGTVLITNGGAFGSGTVTAKSASSLTLAESVKLTNAISLSNSLTIISTSGKSSTLSGIISGNTGAINQSGVGELILSGTNTFSGGFNATSIGTTTVQNNSALGTGTFGVTGAATLNVTGGLTINNSIKLSNNLTTNVSSGIATLSGDISETAASGLTKTGDGTLILTGNNTYTGGITINAGRLQGDTSSLQKNIVNNGELIFNQNGTGTYADTISGTGSMTVNSTSGSGILQFTGNNTSTTTTTLNSGELQISLGATFSGPIDITSTSGLLSGLGTVNGITNSGYVQAGISTTSTTFGELKVTHDFEQFSNGTTQIKIQPAAVPAPKTDNDLLTIGGNATLGGNLNALLQSGDYTPGTTYKFLTAGGTVTGQYALAFSSNPKYGLVMDYATPGQVSFQVEKTLSLAGAATTPNQYAVGSAIDSLVLTASPTSDLYALLNTLGVQPEAQQQQSLNQMTGEVFGNMQMLALQVGDQFQQRVTSRLVSNAGLLVGGPPSDNTEIRGQSSDYDSISGWGQGYGVSGHLRGDGNGSSVRYTQGGGLYAIDWGDEIDRVGIVGGNSYSRMTDGSSTNGQLTSYQLGTYLLTQNDWAYFLGTANYGLNNNATNRTVTIATTTENLHAGFNGDQIGTSFETGLKLQVGPIHVLPLFGMQYLFVGQRTTDEVGGALALHIAREQAHSLRTNLGARLAMEQFVGFGGILWTPYLHGRLVSEMLDNDRIVNSSFNGVTTGGAFTTQGTGLGYHYGIFGVGSEMILNATWSLFGGAEITTSDRFTAATGSLAAVMTFW